MGDYMQITIDELEQWAASRGTSTAVAAAVHSIADDKRSPEAIWEAPTAAEWAYIKAPVVATGDIH